MVVNCCQCCRGSPAVWFEMAAKGKIQALMDLIQQCGNTFDTRLTQYKYMTFYGFYAIHYAVLYGQAEAVRFLLPYEYATLTQQEVLLKSDNINNQKSYKLAPGSSILTLAVLSCHEEVLNVIINYMTYNIEAAQQLIYPNSRGICGYSLAAILRSDSGCKMLKNEQIVDAYFNRVPASSVTPFAQAVQFSNLRNLKVLQQVGKGDFIREKAYRQVLDLKQPLIKLSQKIESDKGNTVPIDDRKKITATCTQLVTDALAYFGQFEQEWPMVKQYCSKAAPKGISAATFCKKKTLQELEGQDEDQQKVAEQQPTQNAASPKSSAQQPIQKVAEPKTSKPVIEETNQITAPADQDQDANDQNKSDDVQDNQDQDNQNNNEDQDDYNLQENQISAGRSPEDDNQGDQNQNDNDEQNQNNDDQNQNNYDDQNQNNDDEQNQNNDNDQNQNNYDDDQNQNNNDYQNNDDQNQNNGDDQNNDDQNQNNDEDQNQNNNDQDDQNQQEDQISAEHNPEDENQENNEENQNQDTVNPIDADENNKTE